MLSKIPVLFSSLVLGSGLAATGYVIAAGSDPATAAPSSSPSATPTAAAPAQVCQAPGRLISGECVVVVHDAAASASPPATRSATAAPSPSRRAEDRRGRDHAEDGEHRAEDREHHGGDGDAAEDSSGREDTGGADSSGRDHPEDD